MFSRLLEFLFSLKTVRITPNTHFAFVWDYPVAITLGAIALAILGYVCYFPQSASSRKKRAMGIVRALVLVTVFLLCFRPELVMEHEEKTRSVVAVWLDNSSSMQLQDPYNGGGPADTAMHALQVKVAADLKAHASTTAPATPANARPNRYQLGTAVLADAAWLKELAQTQDVVFFTGGAHAAIKGSSASEPIDAIIARLKADEPTGTSTDVPTVVKDIVANVQGQRLSAIILLTDGQTTEKGSRLDQAASAAQQADVKVFGVPLGQAEEPFDLKLGAPNLPPKTFIKDPVSVKLHISGTGIKTSTQARVNIYRAPEKAGDPLGQPLATKEITLQASQKELDTDVPLKLEKKAPGREEKFDLIARVEAVNGAEELYVDNNEQKASITVLDAQINVLYVEGYPRWEFRYLKNELIREPTVNVSSLLLSADDDFVQDADPPVFDKQTGKELFPGSIRRFPESVTDLAKYDVILLGDVEPTYFTPTQQRMIVDWVKTRGGGLAWIAGSLYNPEAYRETPMEVLLPITPDEIDPRARIVSASDNTPFNLVLTPAGRALNLFRFFDDPDKSWSQVGDLPQMYWFKPVQGLKPGAIVLATHPTRSAAGRTGEPAPLLVMRQYGAGPVIFSAYCDTWRWRRYTGEPLFQTYWLQLCRLLYASNALGQDRRAQLVVDSNQVEIGTSVKVTLSVKDPTLAGQLPPEVPVKVMDANGQPVETVTLQRTASAHTGPVGPAGSGETVLERLEGSLSASRLGRFTLVLPPGTLPLDFPPVELTVESPRREQENVTTDVASLTTLANKTTGKVVSPTATAELAHAIPDRSLQVVIPQPEELWNKPFALILVVLLVTIEWLIRKSAGLI